MTGNQVQAVLEAYSACHPGYLPEYQAKELLRAWNLPVPEGMLAEDAASAQGCAARIGYPVVLKVQSPRIIHKSDVGGVCLNLNSPEAVGAAYAEIQRACGKLDPEFKVLVEPMQPAGLEVIIGVSTDAQFGPVIMFGLGGVFVELFKDVSFRLLPIDKKQAFKMVSSIKAFPLFKGYRGKTGIDLEYLINLIVSISDLVTRYPSIIEMDLNPVVLYPKNAVIVDARVQVRPKGG